MTRYRWVAPAEVTYSEFGERGSIDLFGLLEEALAVAVCEVKSAIGSLEELNRTLDAKVRLAPKLCKDRYGWSPRYVGRLLIVPEGSTIHRIYVRRAGATDLVLVHEFSGETRAGDWLVYRPESPLEGVNVVRIHTISSPSWVAWGEVQIYGEEEP